MYLKIACTKICADYGMLLANAGLVDAMLTIWLNNVTLVDANLCANPGASCIWPNGTGMVYFAYASMMLVF